MYTDIYIVSIDVKRMTGLGTENPNTMHQLLTATLLAQVTDAARVQAVFQGNIVWKPRLLSVQTH